MKNWLIPIVLVGLCAGAYLAARHRQRAGTSGSGSRPGEVAPYFSLRDLSGRTLTLTDYRGKVVLLNFWATWCEPCRHEIPEFIQLQKSRSDLQILGISLDDSTEPVQAFYKEFNMTYPVAVGDAALATKYGGILGLPITFILGCDGRVSAKHIGEVNISDVTSEISSLQNEPACRP
jgi:peroxiredoxin